PAPARPRPPRPRGGAPSQDPAKPLRAAPPVPARSSVFPLLRRNACRGRCRRGDPYNPALEAFPLPRTIMTDQLAKKSEAWSARFSEPGSELVKRYTASVSFDRRLASAHIDGSLAHPAMPHASARLV